MASSTSGRCHAQPSLRMMNQRSYFSSLYSHYPISTLSMPQQYPLHRNNKGSASSNGSSYTQYQTSTPSTPRHPISSSHNHHHLSLSSSQPPSVSIIISPAPIWHYNFHFNSFFKVVACVCTVMYFLFRRKFDGEIPPSWEKKVSDLKVPEDLRCNCQNIQKGFKYDWTHSSAFPIIRLEGLHGTQSQKQNNRAQ